MPEKRRISTPTEFITEFLEMIDTARRERLMILVRDACVQWPFLKTYLKGDVQQLFMWCSVLAPQAYQTYVAGREAGIADKIKALQERI